MLSTGLSFANAQMRPLLSMQSLIDEAEIARWASQSLESGENVLATSNQGTILKFSGDGEELVLKCAMGDGLVRRARQRTLEREYQAYRKMVGLAGVPKCYGMIDEKFLAIEWIRGVPYREAVFQDRDRWFEEFLGVIRGFHDRGVSHGDLKSKSNILVTDDERVCVIDFGTSFVHKSGLHPFNNWLFGFGKRLDLNAWVKHKYFGRYEDASAEDRKILSYSLVEKVVRKARGG